MVAVVVVVRLLPLVAVRALRPAPQLGAPAEVAAAVEVVVVVAAAAAVEQVQQPLTFELPFAVAVVAAAVPVVARDLVVLAPSPLAAVEH